MDTTRNFYLATLAAILLSICFCESIYGQASIQEISKSLKTYPFSDPDPVAKPGRIYPYFRFDGYTDKGEMRNWKFIELENPYIKVSVTPEIGGKVWGAYEKATNFPFVYFNNVVKFRDVAMRGAWTSGGIEMNFGDIGHDPTVSNPVDYITRTNADSSVSCFVGAYDWASRTRWTVEVNLPKNKAAFTTKSRWYNASPLDQTYYHWMNAGFRAGGNLEFVYPGTNYIGHGGELNDWPKTSKGQDINFYEKNNFGSYKSYHVLGKATDFFGGYWHKDNIGFVHYAPYYEKLGKKVWIWGLSRQGMIWENLLTDTDGQYVELQSGRLFNQAGAESTNSPFKHFSFQPYGSDSWTEEWYPVKNTGGITKAEDWGAWNIVKKKDWLVFSISPTVVITDTLTIANYSTKPAIYNYRKRLQLEPLKTFTDSIKMVGDKWVSVSFGDKKLYEYNPTGVEEGIERPLKTPKDFNWNTEYGQYLKGKDLASQRRFVEAEAVLMKLLAKNKYHIPALGEMAQLTYRKGLYEDAAKYAQKALSINTYDPLANYMLGLAAYRNNKITAAKEAFSVAVLSPQYRSAALTELTKIAIVENDFTKAQHLAQQALETNANNDHAKHLQIAILRNTNQKTEALTQIAVLLEENPLDHLARAEKYLLTKSDTDKNDFKSLIKNELPHENFIEMALWYRDFRDNEAASAVLEVAPSHPMVKLWANDLKGNFKDAVNALTMSPNLVFPFRPEAEKMFLSLINNEKKSGQTYWQLHYYYGILLWQLNRQKEAKTQFLQCADMPNYAPFYLAKAELFKDDKSTTQKILERAYILEPENWRVVKILADYYAENNLLQRAWTINELKFSKLNRLTNTADHEIYILGQQKARFLFKLGRYKECVDFMKTMNLLPNEGASGAHTLFREANIRYAVQLLKLRKNTEAVTYLDQAETWPENLGSGAPYNPDNRLTAAFKRYITTKKLSDLEKVRASLEKKDAELLNLFLRR